MSHSYHIFPELETQIKDSKLLDEFSELGEEIYISGEPSNDEINASFDYLSESIKNEIKPFIVNAIKNKTSWSIDESSTIPISNCDYMLAFGGHLDDIEGFDNILLKFREYGFESILQMMVSLSAYRVSEESFEGMVEVHRWITHGVRSVLGFGVNGETKLFQYDEKSVPVMSPFGVPVLFRPRQLSGINEVYNAEELRLFAIVLRFAYELGIVKQIFRGNENNFLLKMKGMFPGIDFGKDEHYDHSITHADAKDFLDTPIGKGTHGFPCMTHEHISYQVEKKEDTLIIPTISQGSLNGSEIVITKEDCREILEGLFMSFTGMQKKPKLLIDLIDKALEL